MFSAGGDSVGVHVGGMSSGKSPARKVVLLIGTVKGVFLYETNGRRSTWKLSGPHLGGWEIFSLCGDTRRGRILAGTGSFEHGPTIRISEDGGKTWKGVKRDPKFTKTAKDGKGAKAAKKGKGAVAVEAELKHIWQIVPGHPSEPGTWYAGVDDAALFVSRDDGDTWSELKGLSNHPTRAQWTPGFGGLCLHSVVVDPTNAKRLWVAISAVGVFRSDDAGATWKVCNQGLYYVSSDFVLEGELGRCVHKLLLDPTRPGSLALQFHGGVFTSDNAGDSWKRISAGLPHEFGFPMVATPRGDFFVVPLLADSPV